MFAMSWNILTFPMRQHWLLVASCAVIAGMITGCDSRPSAPVLRDGRIYVNPQEGFRFLVPEGWSQLANSILPRGDLDGEMFVVRYRMRTPEEGAVLQVVCFSEQLTDNLHEHHAGPSYRVERWKPEGPEETLEINGVTASRHIYSSDIAGRPTTKEVVAFKRNGRVYNFVGMFMSRDDKARQQIRRAVGSTIWEK
jgi:hypothetical protein